MEFILIILAIGVMIILFKRNNPEKSSTFASNYQPKPQPISFRKTKTVGDLIIDERNDLFKLKGVSRKTFNSSDIIKYELNEDGQSITSGGLSIGKAVVGSILANGTGALLGGLTGKRKNKDIVTDMHIAVTMRGNNSGYYKLPLITQKTKKHTKDYKVKLEEARSTMAAFDIMTDKYV